VVNAGQTRPLVTVIIPTHDHPSTLDLAVRSVLAQSVDAIELMVIGDGVGDATRTVLANLDDPRLHFVDEPKTPSRAELTRHRILTESPSTYACYLGDDDVMLADHIETMMALLDTVDFAHPLPMYIEPEGRLAVHPVDLSDPEYLRWHLHPDHNAISLTGVAHRIDAYRRLPFGWREPPSGWHSDHYMWEQWFRAPGLRFATGDRLTVLKFEASLRTGWSPERRRAELLHWIERTKSPDFDRWWRDRVTAALQASLSTYRLLHSDLMATAAAEQAQRSLVEADLAVAQRQLQDIEQEVSKLRVQESILAEMRSTKTWRLHDRLAATRLALWLARQRRGHNSASTH
jgi:hypothetical protein